MEEDRSCNVDSSCSDDDVTMQSDAESIKSIENKVLSEENEEAIELPTVIDENMINKKTLYSKIIELVNKPRFEDITCMINSTVPFLIDGDSLMVSALNQKNYNLELGGQFLHMIYYCERILDIFVQKGGNFIIVFFNVWKLVWKRNWHLQTSRLALYNHFKHNTTFRVFNFPVFYASEFRKFIDVEQPRCILLNLSMHIDAVRYANNDFTCETKAERLFCNELLFFLSNHLPCIDIDHVEVEVSTVSSYHVVTLVKLETLRNYETKLISDLNELLMDTSECLTLKRDYKGEDARRAVIIIAASEYLKSVKDNSIVRLLLLCYAAQEVLQLENRCCPRLEVDAEYLNKLDDIVRVWHEKLFLALNSLRKLNVKWNTIADLWQGTLFSNVCYLVAVEIVNGETLGSFQQAYETLVRLIEQESGVPFKPYPIKPLSGVKLCEPVITDDKVQELVTLQPIQNPLIEKFCGDVFEGVQWSDPKVVFAHEEFDELCHWHSRKPITDESDHIRSTLMAKPTSKYELKRYDRNVANWAKYMNIYGSSLEGNRCRETIICNESKSKKGGAASKKVVKVKESKKAKEIKERNQKEKGIIQCEKEAAMLNNLQSTLKKFSDLNDLCRKLDEINLLLDKLSTKQLVLEGQMLKLKVLFNICKHVHVRQGDESDVYIKQVFLTIRSVLNMKNDVQLTERHEKLISTLLCRYGLNEIAVMNNLEIVKCEAVLKLNWIRYQLQYIGPELEKEREGLYDPDVGFAPDAWQVQFINAIRKNQSALVVAPTSSGKTFASYYCMKRVLQETQEGIVVYVSPTKALVNQVAATMYHRFANVKLNEGTSAVGIFTRDFKTNALNSRILVTVPQCLDILLLSPRQYSWVKKVRYVIFDEVHRLSGNQEGLVWERCLLMIRCPFLALSATISDPEYFHSWLQLVENFKHEQDRVNNTERPGGSYRVNLVIHLERHSDLVKYTYGSRGLLHYHPYSTLSDFALNMHQGIPSTVTLSPHETLQLFDVMRSSASDENFSLPSEILPEIFFTNNCAAGFLKRNTVREYEKLLGKVFYDLYINHKQVYIRIVRKLHPGENYSDSLGDFQNLLEVMKKKNMLPTIVFSYSRDCIETLHAFITISSEKSIPVIDRRIEKKVDQIEKRNKKEQEKEDAKNVAGDRGVSSTSYKQMQMLNILRETHSQFKGVGKADANDIKFIEKRLISKGISERHLIVQGFQHGFAYHHGGLNNVLRSSVEMLFRMGIVKVVFATGTLAMGIHMPCKSIVVFGDSPFLNSLEYHQMSGRAGRRGFDIEGNVVFMALPQIRQNTLITDKLPKLIGNYPISVTLVLRLLLLVTKVTDKNCATEEASRTTVSCALTLLENSLIFQFKPFLRNQIKHFVSFATQFLLIQDIIGPNGCPLKLSGLITHLHYHEPANLALAYLLRTGVLRKLVTSSEDDVKIQWSLVVVLSHLFTRIRLHKTQLNKEYKNSVVELEPLPKIVRQGLKKYNKEVKFVFDEYFLSVSRKLVKSLGVDDTLPLSQVQFQPVYDCDVKDDVADTLSGQIKKMCVPKTVCSAFVAMSGHGDKDLFTDALITNIRHEICPDINVIPLINLNNKLNSYAADFYRHGIKKAIILDNGLKGGQEFTLLKDFYLMLKVVVVSLKELEPVNSNDPLLRHFTAVLIRYKELFNKAFSLNAD